MNLSEEELAFYAALAADESVVRAMDDQKLWVIAAACQQAMLRNV